MPGNATVALANEPCASTLLVEAVSSLAGKLRSWILAFGIGVGVGLGVGVGVGTAVNNPVIEAELFD